MMEIQAVIGRLQLRRMAEWTQKRNSNSARIWEVAKKYPWLRVPETPTNIVHAAYKCYVFVNPDQLPEGWSRDRIISEINAEGIPCLQGSCSEVYLEKAFEKTPWRPETRLPNAKELGDTSLMFLVHPTLTEDEINHTCRAIEKVGSRIQNQVLVAGAQPTS
jgi:dTDP-4-amino-4,6-dideoxygalactose transaminase